MVGFIYYLCHMEEKDTKKEVIKTSDNRQIIQSYLLTSARYEFSVYEKRIFTSLVNAMQPLLEGKKLAGKVVQDLWGDYHFEFPLSFFMGNEDKTNIKRYKEALIALNDKKFEYEDGEVWRIIRLIERPQYKKRKGVIEFDIASQLVDAFLNFNKGFSKYNLEVSMSLKSVYAVRMYELMANQKRPLTYSIEKLKEMFQVTEQKAYYNTFNFIRRCIYQAQIELDTNTEANANWSFDYEPVRHGRKITAITFTPIHYAEREPAEVQRAEAIRQVHLSHWLPIDLKNHLIREFKFTPREIKNNINTIEAFCRLYNQDTLPKINEIWERARDKRKPKAYLIGAMQLELQEQ